MPCSAAVRAETSLDVQGCDHSGNHRPSFSPIMNGRPTCRPQPPPSNPSIPSSSVRSSMGLLEGGAFRKQINNLICEQKR